MLITLCASHITSMDDIIRIKDMIESHDNQTLKTKLYISKSYENDLLKYIHELASVNTILYIRHTPATQFMHYKLLVNDLLPIYKNIHVLFVFGAIRNYLRKRFILALPNNIREPEDSPYIYR